MKWYQKRELPFNEFIIMMALMMSITALSIDAILPALDAMAVDIYVENAKDTQNYIVFLFIGLALGQLVFGPLSDSIGRRLAIIAGYLFFIAGSIIAIGTETYEFMLLARFLQGFGLAAPKVISVAIIRDLYKGRMMARVMSFIMMTFILVPMIAPLFGQLILKVLDWKAIFYAILSVGLISLSWYLVRQEETLEPSHRANLSPKSIIDAARYVLSNRKSLGYTISAGVISGPFIFYLSSSFQLLSSSYQLGDWFPLYFSGLTIAFAVASYMNGKLVINLGMEYLSNVALSCITLSAILFMLISTYFNGHPPLELLTIYLLVTFFCLALIFGNLNSLAMEPLGKLAGLGAAIIGFLTTIISTLSAVLMGLFFHGSVFPLVIGFGLSGAISLSIGLWQGKGNRLVNEFQM